MIDVAICEDDLPLARNLHQLIDGREGMSVVADTSTLRATLSVSEHVDVWLMDVRLPDGSGVDAARALMRRPAAPRILLMTAHDVGSILPAIDAGVSGFLAKGTLLMNVSTAIQAVYSGFHVGTDAVTHAIGAALARTTLVDPARAATLTRDEVDRRLVEMVSEGLSIQQMSSALSYSPSGIHKRLSRIFRRAGVPNQRALLRWLRGPQASDK